MSIKIKSLEISNEGERRYSKGIHSNHELEYFNQPVYVIEYEETTATGLRAQGSVEITKKKSQDEIADILEKLKQIILDEKKKSVWLE